MKQIRPFESASSELYDQRYKSSPDYYGDSWKNHYQYRELLGITFQADETLLEFGCGNGNALSRHQRTANSRCVGVDAAHSIIDYNSKEFTNCEFYLDLDHVNDPCIFDNVFTAHTLEHVADPLESLNRLLAIASKSLLAIVPFERSWSECSEHYWQFSLNSFSNTDKKIVAFRGLTNKAGNTELVLVWHQDPAVLDLISRKAKSIRYPMYRYRLFWMLRRHLPAKLR